MNTSIKYNDMFADQSDKPHLFSFGYSEQFGEFLIVGVNGENLGSYPGWRQTREFNGKEFDIMGTGQCPSRHVIEIWDYFDRNFSLIYDQCRIAVVEYPTNAKISTKDQPGLEAIAKAVESEELRIVQILFGDTDVVSINLDYPDGDKYYIRPQVHFKDKSIVNAVLSV